MADEFSNQPLVRVENVCVFQGHNVVLEDVNFSVNKGDFVYIIGRTGSGKSSLLRTLYADLELRLGEMEVAGYSIKRIKKTEVPFLRRRLGIIFQDFQLFADRTVDENLKFVMRATGWKDRVKMKQRLSDVLVRVGLGSAGFKKPHQLVGRGTAARGHCPRPDQRTAAAGSRRAYGQPRSPGVRRYL